MASGILRQYCQGRLRDERCEVDLGGVGSAPRLARLSGKRWLNQIVNQAGKSQRVRRWGSLRYWGQVAASRLKLALDTRL